MASGFSRQGKEVDNLEFFLNDVFKKECLIEAAPEEINFIQNGIETLVMKIVDLYLKKLSEYFQMTCFDPKSDQEEVNEIISIIKETLLLQKQKPNIIKVGSFYEGTKNKFPNEFDFIFPLACWEWERWNKSEPLLDVLSRNMIDVTFCKSVSTENKETLSYVCLDKEIKFDTLEQVHGPAFMLKFNYHNGSGEKRQIRADLVIAYSLPVNEELKMFVNECVNPISFRKEVIKIDSFLNVHGAYVNGFRTWSVTPTEVRYIRNISKNHVKVYRILKHLFNGHGDAERVKERSGKKKEGYSSYGIKTMVIYHHDECNNPNIDKIGGCVIQILESIYKHSKTGIPPVLLKQNPSVFNFSWEPMSEILNHMIEYLKLLQASKEAYDYNSFKFISVSGQYLETHYREQR